MQLLAKLKKILYMGFRATLNFRRPDDCSRVALIAKLEEHCTGVAEVVGLNPARSLIFFQVSVLVVLQ